MASQDRMMTYRQALGWCLIPAVLYQQFGDMRAELFLRGSGLISADLVLYAVITLVCLPWTISALSQMSLPARRVIALFAVVASYAFLSALLYTSQPTVVSMRTAEIRTPLNLMVDRVYLVMPPISGILAMAAGVSLVAVMPAAYRRAQLWWSAATLVVASYVSWFAIDRHVESLRMYAGIGGAAVLYMALLPCLALFIGTFSTGYHRKASIVLAIASGFAIVLTMSRAGFIVVALFAGITLARKVRLRDIPRYVWAGFGAFVLAVAIFASFLPEVATRFTLSDELRESNLKVSWSAWSESVSIVLIGQGFGRVWPWYVFETGLYGSMPTATTNTWGEALPHPHSLFVLALVELGLVGFALVAAIGVGIICCARLVRGDGVEARLVLAALVASVPGWLFDTYLLKNVPVAFWWWAVLISVAGFHALRQPTTHDAQDDKTASAAS